MKKSQFLYLIVLLTLIIVNGCGGDIEPKIGFKINYGHPSFCDENETDGCNQLQRMNGEDHLTGQAHMHRGGQNLRSVTWKYKQVFLSRRIVQGNIRVFLQEGHDGEYYEDFLFLNPNGIRMPPKDIIDSVEVSRRDGNHRHYVLGEVAYQKIYNDKKIQTDIVPYYTITDRCRNCDANGN